MENKPTFEDLKVELLDKAKEANACDEGYEEAEATTNEEELLTVIYKHLDWCVVNKVITHEYMAKFDQELCLKSGIANTGKECTGFANSGDSNSGYWNSGYRNSGSWNSGDSNSGYWNSGDRNSGDSNSGYRNSGAFCTSPDPIMYLFDKPCKSMTVKQWERSKAVQLMNSIDPTVWVPWSAMSKAEREANPKYEASEGYTKSIPIKEAWKNTWGNWSDENKAVFTSLENFDSEKFEQITGIKVNS